MINQTDLWLQIKEKLNTSLPTAVFKQIFEPIKEIYKIEDNIVYFAVENHLVKYRIDKFYLKTMNDYLQQLTESSFEFKVITFEDVEKEKQEKIITSKPTSSQSLLKSRNLRPDYTFENFVTGEANREAFTFSMKVAESPHVTINPFYIFGDIGLGKTHLMTAIAHYMLANNPNLNVVFTTGQQFAEDYFKAKNKNQKNPLLSEEFDNYYRNADLLLVDDVQYLADKQGSQDEFFKIFEILFNNGKQIIVTSDRPANELNIISRLKSRFSYGIQTDIRKPNLLLRKTILKRKLILNEYISDPSVIPDDVITYIAEHFDQNVRELEGALRRFVSYCVSFNIDYTLDNAIAALDSIIPKDRTTKNETNYVHIEKIKEIISSYFNINVKDLSSPSRKQEFVYARQIAIYILKNRYNQSLEQIGSVLGNRDHSTVSHGLEKIQNLIDNDVNVREDIENITNNLNKLYE